jgi:SAM-dependent methyltransferase
MSDWKEVVIDDPEARTEWKKFGASGMAELIAGYNLCQAVFAFIDSGLAGRMREDRAASVATLAEGCDTRLADSLLRYLVVRHIVERDGEGYRLTKRGAEMVSEVPVAQLGFYRDAYGPVLDQMGGLLTKQVTYGKEVLRDGEALGRHCSTGFHYFGTKAVLEALAGMSANCLLDLGCGAGGFLVDACRMNPKLRGIGLDISAEAIAFARKAVAEAGLADRIKFLVGDAFQPQLWPELCNEADAIFTVGTLHEQFRDGEEAVIRLLDTYADMLRTRKGLILGEPELFCNEQDADFFLIHAFTNQGFPRPRDEWLKLFSKTKLRCRRVLSAPDTGPKFAFFDLTTKD